MPVITPMIKRQFHLFTRLKFLSPLPTITIVRETGFLTIAATSLVLLGSPKAYAAPALTAPYKAKFIQDCKDYTSQQRGVCDCIYTSLAKKYGGDKALAAIDQRQVPTPKNYSSDALWATHQCTYKK